MLISAKIRIITAFIILLESTQFDKISVKMIVEKANLNRKTFYDYFNTREDLYIYLENTVFDEFKKIFNNSQYVNLSPKQLLNEHLQSYSVNIEICNHILNHRAYYLNRFSNSQFYIKFARILKELLQQYIKDGRISEYLSYGATGYLYQWLINDCIVPIEEVAIALAESGIPSIIKALERA